MSYKPDEQELMAYLYGELEGADKEKLEQYLLANPEARKQYDQFTQVSKLLNTIKDKEVIAPPIFVGESKQRWLWDAPYFKTIISIAASLIFVILVARFAGTRLSVSSNELRISFGDSEITEQPETTVEAAPSLTADHVQQMINESLHNNNAVLHENWKESQQELESSIRQNLALNSGKIDRLVREASTASQEQIQHYVSTLQTTNMKLVKDYFELTAGEQKQYIEGLLVDFAKYLQQQRNDDLQLVQLRLNKLEQNTNVFKHETEQILTSIISTVGNTPSTQTKY